MDFSNQLIRCSAIGKIMTNGRAKNEMGETCKTFLKELYIEKVYGFRKDIKSKYIEKGLLVEENAISFYSVQNGGFYYKNEQRFNNEFLTGEPDIITDEFVIDITSSYSVSTHFDKIFDKLENKSLNKDYYYQLMGYMNLTGLRKAKVAYVLVDTPEKIIEDEKRKLSWEMYATSDLSPEFLEACEDVDRNHDLSRVPVEKRIIEFDIEYDEKVVEEIYKRVQECRTYLNSLNG